MKKVLLSMIVLLSMCAASFAADEETKVSERVDAAAQVLSDIQGAPDKGIPQEVLGSAECVAVVPSMLKGGFIVGAKYGRGLASCRTEKGWSAPAFFVVTGGSFDGVSKGAVFIKDDAVVVDSIFIPDEIDYCAPVENDVFLAMDKMMHAVTSDKEDRA